MRGLRGELAVADGCAIEFVTIEPMAGVVSRGGYASEIAGSGSRGMCCAVALLVPGELMVVGLVLGDLTVPGFRWPSSMVRGLLLDGSMVAGIALGELRGVARALGEIMMVELIMELSTCGGGAVYGRPSVVGDLVMTVLVLVLHCDWDGEIAEVGPTVGLALRAATGAARLRRSGPRWGWPRALNGLTRW